MSIELDVGTGGKVIRTRQTSDGAVSGEHTQIVEPVPADYVTEILRGNISGLSMFSAMGERESIGTTLTGEDLWRGNQLTPAPTSHILIPTPADAGEQMTIVSEDADDDGDPVGTGARTVRIHYCDDAGDAQIHARILRERDGGEGRLLATARPPRLRIFRLARFCFPALSPSGG